MTLTRARNRNPSATALITIALLAALACKALIPAGFMPAGKAGLIKLVVCSGMGEKTILVPADTAPSSENHGREAAKDLCPYQILSSGKSIIPVVHFLAVPELHVVNIVFTRPDPFLSSSEKHAHAARGPPFV